VDERDGVPLPDDADVDLAPPGPAEVEELAHGVAELITQPDGALTAVQQTLMEATFQSMTGHRPDLAPAARRNVDLAERLRHRNSAFRTRLVQQAILGALVLDPLPPAVVERIRVASDRLGVDESMIDTARQFADQQFELAAIDFDRNGYTADWSSERAAHLHTSREIDVPWRDAPDDDELAARWHQLETLPEGTLGLAVTRFYRARGFVYPGRPGSVSPLLAQHDWVHVLADYGATIDNELEVFAFIARANDDPRGFSFLAMVVSLFETGALASGVGLFTPDVGHLRQRGMPERVADAMRRGAQCHGSIDFLGLDWFELASHPLEELRHEFGIGPKSTDIVSPGPFEPGGMTAFQLDAGRAAAAEDGRRYESWGATP
jgi:hypothetical protein